MRRLKTRYVSREMRPYRRDWRGRAAQRQADSHARTRTQIPEVIRGVVTLCRTEPGVVLLVA
jgi:hypothetical protein